MNKTLRFLRRLPLGLTLALAVLSSDPAYARLTLPIGGSSNTCPANTSCPNTPSGGDDTGSHSCGPSNTGQPCEAKVGNPIHVITGNKYQEEVDLPALPGVLGLEIVRHYNSGLSRPTDPNGLPGRGWRLSYETGLFVIGNTIQVLQADGRRLIFNRDVHNPSLCATPNPAHGRIAVTRTSQGNAYLWTRPGGNKLLFDDGGKLVRIQAPTGEFVSLHYDRQQRLDQVTDPQGRSLHLRYPEGAAARSFERFRGVQAIDSPVGRFVYEYGSPMPRDGNLDRQRSVLANLVKVTYPQDGGGNTASRLYHYEDPSHLTLLTGMSVAGAGSDGRAMNQRIATWRYDAAGRAILSTHADGVEQVTLDYRQPGQTTITNSLHQQTTYRHAIVGGEFRLLEVRGPGCASCGDTNVKYGYDKLGRLVETTRLDEQGRPLLTIKTELDPYGRPLKVGRIAYRNGHAQPVQWRLRYEYDRAHWKPVLIARPSVVPGREVATRMTYNGQRTKPLAR